MMNSLIRHTVSVVWIAALALTGCSVDNSAEQAQTKVDSIVNAKLSAIQAQMKRNNDSLINAMAIARADSVMAAGAPVKK